jgi:cytochrome c
MTHSASKLQVAILTLGLIGAESAEALDPREQRGFNFARTNCATCHEIGKIGASPVAEAPPFRDLHTRYPVEELEESLAEGISTGHPSMPEWRLDPGEIGDLIAYLKTL